MNGDRDTPTMETSGDQAIDRALTIGRYVAAAVVAALACARFLFAAQSETGLALVGGAALYAAIVSLLYFVGRRGSVTETAARHMAIGADTALVLVVAVAAADWSVPLYPLLIGSIRLHQTLALPRHGRAAAAAMSLAILAAAPFSSFWSAHPILLVIGCVGMGIMVWEPGLLRRAKPRGSVQSAVDLLAANSGTESAADNAAVHATAGMALEPLVESSTACQRLLLVDQGRTSLLVNGRILTRAGYAVSMASTVEAALAALTTAGGDPFRALLVDIETPDVDRLVAEAGASVDPATASPRIIGLVTADLSLALSAETAAAMVDRVSKPVDIPLLLQSVERACAAWAPDGIAARAGIEGSTQPADAIDLRALRDLENLGGLDFVRDIVNQFVADGASALRSLADAMFSGDVSLFRDQAHALRSSAANVGARSIYATCLAWRKIEPDDLARNGRDHMRDLEQQFDAASRMLTDYIAETPNPGLEPPSKPGRLASTDEKAA